MKVIYTGKCGSVAKNELGTWAEGDAKEIGEGPGQVPASAAAALVASGVFVYGNAEHAGDPEE